MYLWSKWPFFFFKWVFYAPISRRYVFFLYRNKNKRNHMNGWMNNYWWNIAECCQEIIIENKSVGVCVCEKGGWRIIKKSFNNGRFNPLIYINFFLNKSFFLCYLYYGIDFHNFFFLLYNMLLSHNFGMMGQKKNYTSMIAGRVKREKKKIKK